jgi:hypothetical protein
MGELFLRGGGDRFGYEPILLFGLLFVEPGERKKDKNGDLKSECCMLFCSRRTPIDANPGDR